MANQDLKSVAQSAEQDYYELLGVNESVAESDIPRAYRKTALKYHPDKVGANQEALDKFHLVQIAYDILSDGSLRALYDNARRGRAEKKARDDALNGHRRQMKEDLERRENEALKRKRQATHEEAAFDAELQRLSEDGKRRRKEHQDRVQREAQEAWNALNGPKIPVDAELAHSGALDTSVSDVSETDRSIIVRYAKSSESENLSKEDIRAIFERFGPIAEVVLMKKKAKMTALLVFRSIVGAHALMTDFVALREADMQSLGRFELVGWVGGKQPDCIPKASQPMPSPVRSAPTSTPKAPSTPKVTAADDDAGLKRIPSFASFKGGTPKTTGPGTPSSHDIMMMRLKNAERRRLEEKLRAEEAALAIEDST